MNDITDLERRITSALDRIGQGLDAMNVQSKTSYLPQADGSPEEVQSLREELDAEKTANAQLEERVRAIKEKQETTVARLEQEVSELRAQLLVRDTELQKVKKVNAQLRGNNQALRDANAQGLGDAHLINKSMMAELDALRSSREMDRQELDEILEELKPLVGEAANA